MLINFDNKFQGGRLFQRGRLLDREEYAHIAHAQTQKQTYTSARAHTHTHTCICIYIYIYIYIYVYVYIYNLQKYARARTHKNTHAHTHKHTRTMNVCNRDLRRKSAKFNSRLTPNYNIVSNYFANYRGKGNWVINNINLNQRSACKSVSESVDTLSWKHSPIPLASSTVCTAIRMYYAPSIVPQQGILADQNC